MANLLTILYIALINEMEISMMVIIKMLIKEAFRSRYNMRKHVNMGKRGPHAWTEKRGLHARTNYSAIS